MSRRLIRIAVIAVLVAAVAAGAWIALHWQHTVIVPIDSIKSIYVHPGRDEDNDPGFNVPEEHWPKLLNSLTPYRRDLNPAKWLVYRDVTLKLLTPALLTSQSQI